MEEKYGKKILRKDVSKHNNNNIFYLIQRHIQFQIVHGALRTLKSWNTNTHQKKKHINILVTHINNYKKIKKLQIEIEI